MSTFFVDTSALGKRYINEVGSTWVRGWMRPSAGNVILVSEITSVETFSAFARLRREDRLTEQRCARLQNILLWHLEHEYLVIPINGSVLAQARLLLNRHPLRTLDAIQLAAAHYARSVLDEPIVFVTADKKLLDAAAEEAFAVDDPNAHS